MIIGAGYTGSSLAYHILEKDVERKLKIVILEAREACSGATGRNGMCASMICSSALLRRIDRLTYGS